jgi:hypothetical protein
MEGAASLLSLCSLPLLFLLPRRPVQRPLPRADAPDGAVELSPEPGAPPADEEAGAGGRGSTASADGTAPLVAAAPPAHAPAAAPAPRAPPLSPRGAVSLHLFPREDGSARLVVPGLHAAAPLPPSASTSAPASASASASSARRPLVISVARRRTGSSASAVSLPTRGFAPQAWDARPRPPYATSEAADDDGLGSICDADLDISLNLEDDTTLLVPAAATTSADDDGGALWADKPNAGSRADGVPDGGGGTATLSLAPMDQTISRGTAESSEFSSYNTHSQKAVLSYDGQTMHALQQADHRPIVSAAQRDSLSTALYIAPSCPVSSESSELGSYSCTGSLCSSAHKKMIASPSSESLSVAEAVSPDPSQQVNLMDDRARLLYPSVSSIGRAAPPVWLTSLAEMPVQLESSPTSSQRLVQASSNRRSIRDIFPSLGRRGSGLAIGNDEANRLVPTGRGNAAPLGDLSTAGPPTAVARLSYRQSLRSLAALRYDEA